MVPLKPFSDQEKIVMPNFRAIALMARAMGSVIPVMEVVIDAESGRGLSAIVADGTGLTGTTVTTVTGTSEGVGVTGSMRILFPGFVVSR